MDVRAYNRRAWDRQVEQRNPWTIPVSPEVIAAARHGEWSIVVTEQKPIPREWFPPPAGAEVLCLASGGGQQGPVLAAAGARVTVFDNRPKQLAQDRMVAEREALELTTVEGDMRDLSVLGDACFDLIIHPLSNVFVPEVRPIWQEAHRVLRPGGVLIAGFSNPDIYVFDWLKAEEGVLEAVYPLPYDSRDLSPEELQRQYPDDAPLEFSHSLQDQIGGQLDAGFVLTALYEDTQASPVGRYMPGYFATRAVKAGVAASRGAR